MFKYSKNCLLTVTGDRTDPIYTYIYTEWPQPGYKYRHLALTLTHSDDTFPDDTFVTDDAFPPDDAF